MPSFKRWVLPGVLLQVLVNPAMKPAKAVFFRCARWVERAGAARCMRWAVWLQLQHLLMPGVLLTRARRRLRDLELFGFRHASEQRRESARVLRSMASFFD